MPGCKPEDTVIINRIFINEYSKIMKNKDKQDVSLVYGINVISNIYNRSDDECKSNIIVLLKILDKAME